MKTIIIGLAAATAMTGCTIERTVVQTPETTTTQTATPPEEYRLPATASVEDDFINSVIAVSGPLLVPQSEVLETGWATCEGIDSGITEQEIKQVILDSSRTEDDVVFLTSIFGSAVLYLCPEYSWMIDGY